MFQPIYHVSVSPTDGNGPTQGQRKTLTRVGIEPFPSVIALCGPCVGPFPSGNGPTQGQRKTLTRVGIEPFPSVGLTLTWYMG